MEILPPDFFARPAPVVARELIGAKFVRKIGRSTVKVTITETEAYEGPQDLASHASRGRTPRTEIMFGPPGRFYVYLVYGMHYMVNVVTGAQDFPSAVLLRGSVEVTGPGKLARFLSIDKTFNSLPALPKTGAWFEKSKEPLKEKMKGKIMRTPRIGVGYAGPVWSLKKYRFIFSRSKTSHA